MLGGRRGISCDPMCSGSVACRLVRQFGEGPPTGDDNRLTDLTLSDHYDGTYTLEWHYQNLGDYDHNGAVGISDITPIAMHYGEEVSEGDPDRNSIQAVVDGSENDIVDIAALAKREETLFTRQNGAFREVKLDETNPGLSLLIAVRDEAHRFCLKQHRARRQKAAVHSLLDEIRGVGPVRRKRLLKQFGSLEKMREAGVDEIAQVPGVSLSLAQRIYAALLEDAFVEIAVEEASFRRRMRLRPVEPDVEE